MSCQLQNITDPKLNILVGKYGADTGATIYLKEFADLIKNLETTTSVPMTELVEINTTLQSRNVKDNTAHSLLVSDGKNQFMYGSQELNPKSK